MFCQMKSFSVPSKLKLTKAADNSPGTNGRDSIIDDAARAASADKNRKRKRAKQAAYRARKKKAKMESSCH